MPSNAAAWLVAKHAKLEVKSAPYTSPREDEIVIKNHAVAINPIDWMKTVRRRFAVFLDQIPITSSVAISRARSSRSGNLSLGSK
jgi:NADPH:quinone reductase-like Zn-dependent oxidoreductase